MIRQIQEKYGGALETSPKLWAAFIAALIAAIIATLLTRSGLQLGDADEELLKAIAPTIAGLLTGYWWDDDWEWQKALPKPSVLAVLAGAVAYWIGAYLLGRFGFKIDTWWKEVLLAAGPIIVGCILGLLGLFLPSKIWGWGYRRPRHRNPQRT